MVKLREVLNPSDAHRMGHSGWIGYDMFCMYEEIISQRNQQIFSASSFFSQKTDKTVATTTQNNNVNKNTEKLKQLGNIIEEDQADQGSSSGDDDRSNMT